jgi:hypothetical protein
MALRCTEQELTEWRGPFGAQVVHSGGLGIRMSSSCVPFFEGPSQALFELLASAWVVCKWRTAIHKVPTPCEQRVRPFITCTAAQKAPQPPAPSPYRSLRGSHLKDLSGGKRVPNGI